MASYVFLTSEGCTFQPGSESKEPDIENLQVIGFSEGRTADEAFMHLVDENSSPLDTSFDEIFSYRLGDDYEGTRRDYSLSATRMKSKSGA